MPVRVRRPRRRDAARRKRTATADYDLFIWGWSWGPDPSGPLEIFTCDAIGGSSDSLWCDESYDETLRRAEPAGRRRAQGRPRRDAAVLVRPGAVSHPVTTTTTCTPIGRTSSPTGRTSRATGTPLFTYGTLELHAARAWPRTRRPARRPVRRMARAGLRPRRRRRVTAAGARRASDNTLLIVGLRRGRRGRRRRARPVASPAGHGRGRRVASDHCDSRHDLARGRAGSAALPA